MAASLRGHCPNLAFCPDLAQTLLFVQTLPRPCPNLAQTFPAQTLPKPSFLSRPCPNLAQTLPRPCPNLACPDLAQTLLFVQTLPQPCPDLAKTLPAQTVSEVSNCSEVTQTILLKRKYHASHLQEKTQNYLYSCVKL